MIDLESSTLISWQNMRNEATGEYVNDATVTGTLKDADSNTIGTFTLSYVASSNGKYQGYITPAMVADVTACDELTVELTATSGAYTGFRKWTEVADYRGKV